MSKFVLLAICLAVVFRASSAFHFKTTGFHCSVRGFSSLNMVTTPPDKKTSLKKILSRRRNPKPVPHTGAAEKDVIENTDTAPGAQVIPIAIAAATALTDSPTIPISEKKIPKVEGIKINSNYLYDPLQEEMTDDRIFVGPDAVVVLKYHGSYQQDNRDRRARGREKEYSFMLRLKQPFGECPPHLYKELGMLICLLPYCRSTLS